MNTTDDGHYTMFEPTCELYERRKMESLDHELTLSKANLTRSFKEVEGQEISSVDRHVITG